VHTPGPGFWPGALSRAHPASCHRHIHTSHKHQSQVTSRCFSGQPTCQPFPKPSPHRCRHCHCHSHRRPLALPRRPLSHKSRPAAASHKPGPPPQSPASIISVRVLVGEGAAEAAQRTPSTCCIELGKHFLGEALGREKEKKGVGAGRRRLGRGMGRGRRTRGVGSAGGQGPSVATAGKGAVGGGAGAAHLAGE